MRNATVVLNTFLFFVAAMGVAGTTDSLALYLAAEIAGGLAILRSFCLVHDLSHGVLLKGRRRNDAAGLLASWVCALPYYPWKRVHIEHHTWAGWRHRDPTESDTDFADLKPAEQWLATWAWRLSLPLLGFSFSCRTFWNIPRLRTFFPARDDRRRFWLSVLSIPAVHGLAWALLGSAYPRAYLPAFTLFLFLLDPLMISQHVGIPLLQRGSRDVRPVRAEEQEVFARTLVFPRWFARHVLLGFNYHSAHHARPAVPGHRLDEIPFRATHSESWWRWLLSAKRRPLARLLEEGH